MHDCGLLNRILPEFEGIHCRVIRDFHHKYTVDEHTLLTIRGLETLWNPADARAQALRRAARGAARRPELSRFALLLHDIGKAADADHAPGERPDGAHRARSAGGPGRGAADHRVPGPQPPGDVAGRVPPRPRRPARGRAVRAPGRHRRAAEDAVPDDAGRRRGGELQHPDAVEGRAAVAALRRDLQPSDARLRRRAGAAGSGRPRRGHRRTARRHLRSRS